MRAVIMNVIGGVGEWECSGRAGLCYTPGGREYNVAFTRLLQVALAAMQQRDPMMVGNWGVYAETVDIGDDEETDAIVRDTKVYARVTPAFTWELRRVPERKVQ